MKTKLTFLLALTFLFLFSGSVYGDDLQDGYDAYDRKDYKTAHKLLLPFAEKGVAKAQLNLGVLYQNGRGVPQDYKEAVKWHRLSAEQGMAAAQYNLGHRYFRGQGVPQDYKETVRLFRLAAEQGMADAQHMLGTMYFRGQGVPQDYKEAVRLFRLAAEQGDDDAQLYLGEMYFHGEGVLQDYVLAHMWFNLAGSNGYKDAVKSRKQLETKMSPQQITQAQQLARNWKPNKRIKTAESLPPPKSSGAIAGNSFGQEEVKKEYWDNGKIRTETHYKNGKRDGLRTLWSRSGKKQFDTHYKNGESEVVRFYWDNGKLRREVPYKNEIQEGLETGWYESGEKEKEVHFKNGKLEGLTTHWYESGRKKHEFHYKNGKEEGLETTWYESGKKKKELRRKNGKPVGLMTSWYESGEKEHEFHYKNGKIDGLFTKYYESGRKKYETNYKNGIKHGIKKEWRDKSGQKIRTAKVPQPSIPQPPKSKNVAIATGTGFLFGSRDYIVTNYHVVKGTSQVKVKFLNEEIFDAQVIAKDIQNDVAILKLNKTPSLQTIEMKFGDSSRVRMGDKVFTIGYPSTQILGTKPKYSEGVISAVTGIQDNPTMFQTTVPILPGSSGSPLFNENGEVVGLTTGSLSSIASDLMGSVSHNINYAIKSSFVKNIIGTVPDSLFSNRGIVVVPTDSNSRADFIEAISKNVVLILGKVD